MRQTPRRSLSGVLAGRSEVVAIAPAARPAHGFTLVEVTLAMGIVSFALVAMLGVLPSGLTYARKSMDLTVSAQIVQHIVNDVQQSDFDNLFAGLTPQNGFYTLPLRYFDDQGSEVAHGSTNALYTVWVRASQPGDPDPSVNETTNFTSLPAAPGQARFHPRDMTILTVQIANNPARRNLQGAGANNTTLINKTTQLIDCVAAHRSGISVETLSVAVSRNGKK